jgi:hypothetical protein
MGGYQVIKVAVMDGFVRFNMMKWVQMVRWCEMDELKCRCS